MRKDDSTQDHQASIQEYENIAPYNRGHLFPKGHANNMDDQISTFTLTNAVPQGITFNSGSWNRMETCIKCVMDDYCFNQNDVNHVL
jgi:endonuclease G